MTTPSRPITWIDELDPLGPPDDAVTATALDASNLNEMQDNLVPWATPENHGAAGDGTTNDYTALQAALDTGLNVSLKPGKTYLCRRQLNITTDGQVIHGNGATIKAPAQAVTTTTTTITSGVTSSIVVASTTGLVVGDSIVIEKSGSFDQSSRRITAINGTTVTINGTFGMSSSGTTNVRYALVLFAVAAANVRLTDIIMDGNKSNWTWGRWQHTNAVLGDTTTEENLMVDHCRIVNWYGDGIDPGGPAAVIAFNWIENMAGRGIVFSGTAGSPTNIATRCIGNHVLTCNTDSATGGQDGTGSIDFSQGGPNTLIEGNYVNGGIEGISSNTMQNRSINIIANEVLNMTGVGILIQVSDATTNPHGRVTIRDNQLDTITGIGIQVKGSSTTLTTVMQRVNITGNELKSVTGTGIKVHSDTANKWVAEPIVTDNTVYGSATSQNLIHIYRFKNGVIARNVLIDGGIGVYVDQIASDFVVSNNVCIGQYTGGINLAISTITGAQVSHNRIISFSGGDSTNYRAINTEAGDVVDNYVDVSAGGASNAVRINGAGQLLAGNHIVRGANSTPNCIIVGSGATSPVLKNNDCDGPISVNGAATNVRRRGNLVSSGAASGTAVLVGGTKTVSTAEIQTGDHVAFSVETVGGTPGTLSLGTITNGTSFVINSSSGTDTSTVFWQIVH